uniref:Fibronectin type-III domain-containing protein n=1 Tax=Globisporangium ultimum (strain ATCC 200006 / CBS 805.95 / DAOM BR144) TaxID=431595 RepID=K3WLI2_GLOUD
MTAGMATTPMAMNIRVPWNADANLVQRVLQASSDVKQEPVGSIWEGGRKYSATSDSVKQGIESMYLFGEVEVTRDYFVAQQIPNAVAEILKDGLTATITGIDDIRQFIAPGDIRSSHEIQTVAVTLPSGSWDASQASPYFKLTLTRGGSSQTTSCLRFNEGYATVEAALNANLQLLDTTAQLNDIRVTRSGPVEMASDTGLRKGYVYSIYFQGHSVAGDVSQLVDSYTTCTSITGASVVIKTVTHGGEIGHQRISLATDSGQVIDSTGYFKLTLSGRTTPCMPWGVSAEQLEKKIEDVLLTGDVLVSRHGSGDSVTEVQRLRLTSNSEVTSTSTGLFQLLFTLNGKTAVTDCLAYGISAEDLQLQINQLSNLVALVNHVNVTREGDGTSAWGYGYEYLVNFDGPISIVGGSPALIIETVREGSAGYDYDIFFLAYPTAVILNDAACQAMPSTSAVVITTDREGGQPTGAFGLTSMYDGERPGTHVAYSVAQLFSVMNEQFEIQKIVVSNPQSTLTDADTYKLTLGTFPQTVAIKWNAGEAEMEAALKVAGINSEDIIVTRRTDSAAAPNGYVYTIYFTGGTVKGNLPEMTVATTFTGTGTVAVSTPTQGKDGGASLQAKSIPLALPSNPETVSQYLANDAVLGVYKVNGFFWTIKFKSTIGNIPVLGTNTEALTGKLTVVDDFVPGAASNSYVMTNLLPGINYYVRVAAATDVGLGPFTSTSSIVPSGVALPVQSIASGYALHAREVQETITVSALAPITSGSFSIQFTRYKSNGADTSNDSEGKENSVVADVNPALAMGTDAAVQEVTLRFNHLGDTVESSCIVYDAPARGNDTQENNALTTTGVNGLVTIAMVDYGGFNAANTFVDAAAATAEQLEQDLNRLPVFGDVIVSRSLADEQGGFIWTIAFKDSEGDLPQFICARDATFVATTGTGCETSTLTDGNVLSGDFVIESSIPISYDASAVTMKAALEAMAWVGAVQVVRSAPSAQKGYTWTITFLDYFGDVPTLMATSSLVGTGASIQVREVRKGNSITGAFALSYMGYTTTPVAWDAKAMAVDSGSDGSSMQEKLEALDVVGPINVERSTMDREGGLIWRITFLDNMLNPGDLLLLQANSTLLNGVGVVAFIREVRKGSNAVGDQLWLSFDPPKSDNGSPITKYRVRWDTSATFSARPAEYFITEAATLYQTQKIVTGAQSLAWSAIKAREVAEVQSVTIANAAINGNTFTLSFRATPSSIYIVFDRVYGDISLQITSTDTTIALNADASIDGVYNDVKTAKMSGTFQVGYIGKYTRSLNAESSADDVRVRMDKRTTKKLTMGQEHFIEVVAFNSNGEGLSPIAGPVRATPSQVPSAPSNVDLVVVSGKQIEVFFSPPALSSTNVNPNFNNDISSYIVQWDVKSDFKHGLPLCTSCATSLKGTVLTVTSSLTAFLKVGSKFTIADERCVLNVAAITATRIDVAGGHGCNNFNTRAFPMYYYIFEPAVLSGLLIQGSPPFRYLIANLTVGTKYYVRVAAVNSVPVQQIALDGNPPDNRKWSFPLAATTKDTVPDPPVSVYLYPFSGTTLEVRIQPPERDGKGFGGAEITHFWIDVDTVSTFDSVTKAPPVNIDTTSGDIPLLYDGGPRVYYINNLETGVRYFVQVKAKNSIGYSRAAIAPNPLAPTRNPDAPVNVKVIKHIEVSRSTVNIVRDDGCSGTLWPLLTSGIAALASPGEIASDYQFYETINANTLTYKATGLKAGKMYYLSVTAKNALGLGDFWCPTAPTNAVWKIQTYRNGNTGAAIGSGFFNLLLTRGNLVQRTEPIPFDAVALASNESGSLQSKLEYLGSINSVKVVRTSNAAADGGYTWTITFMDVGDDFTLVPESPNSLACSDPTTCTLGDYRVTATKITAGINNPPCTGAQVIPSVGALNKGQLYYVRVFAYNKVGFSLPALAPNPQKPMVVPGPPTGVTLQVLSVSDLKVLFSPPDDDGGDTVTAYQVEWATDNAFTNAQSGVVSLLAGGAPYYRVISSLVKGKFYFVRVKAKNSQGYGQYQISSPASLNPYTTPSAPTQVLLGVTSSTMLTVQWNVPDDDGGDAVTAYVVQWDISASFDSLGADATKAKIIDTTQRSYTITLLTPETVYFVRVFAVNTGGLGTPQTSTPPSQIPVNTRPGKPHSLQAAATAAAGTILVNWQVPRIPAHVIPCSGTLLVPQSCPIYVSLDVVYGGSSFESYLVQWSDNSDFTGFNWLGVVTNSALLTGLDSGKLYYVRVLTVNSQGLKSDFCARANSGGYLCPDNLVLLDGSIVTGAFVSATPK